MKLVEVTSGEPLIVSMYNKVKASKEWGVYWTDDLGIGHSIIDVGWSPAHKDFNGKVSKEKILVDLSLQNRPKPSVMRFTGNDINKLKLKKMLVPGQFAVDLERWYLFKEPK